jgi:hypothetical protein
MVFILFVILQCCDLATTLLFLHLGVNEGNPLVSAALRAAVNPALPLTLLKLTACGMAFAAWRTRRVRLLRLVNIFYLCCIGWNLAAVATA